MKSRSASSSHGVNRIHETSPLSQGTSTAAQRRKKLDYSSETEEIVKKTKTTSDKNELGMHCHAAEDKKIGKIAHEMMVEASEEAPSLTELVQKNHTEKDEPLVDKQATVLITAVETLARQQSTSDAVSETGSTATGPSRHQPNVAYLEYLNVDMNKSEATSLCQSLNMDMRMTRMEDIMETLKGDFAELKRDLAELKRGMDAILRVYGIDPVTLQPIGSAATPAENTISTASRPIP